MTAITINFKSIIHISNEEFYQLCIDNPDTKFERNADGAITEARQVEIYRLGKDVEVLNSPQTLSDDDILPGFVLDLFKIYLRFFD